MPQRMIYTVEIDGVDHDIEGDRPPTEAEARQVVATQGAAAQPAAAGGWLDPNPDGDQLLENAKGIGRTIRGVAKTVWDHPVQAGAIAGGLAAAPLTGGTSIPASMAAAGLGGAGGAGLGMMLGAAKGDPGIPSTPSGVLGTMATEGGYQAAGEGAGRAVMQGALRLAPRLMQSALKPTQALANARKGAGYGTKEAIAQAVLDEGRIVSPGSHEAAQAALDTTDEAAHTALKGSSVTVDPEKVAQRIEAEGGSSGVFGQQVNAAPDMAAIQGVADNFRANPHLPATQGSPILNAQGLPVTPPRQLLPIPADQAWQIASNTGKNLKGKFGRLGPATVEAEKAGRAEITGQLRDQIPELAPLWDKEAKQITVRDALESAMERSRNRDIAGLTGVVGAVHSPGLAATALADRSPLLKSIAAQGLHQGAPALSPALRAALLERLYAAQDRESSAP